MRLTTFVAALAIAAACDLPAARRGIPVGFTRASAHAQRQLEARLRSSIDRSRIGDAHRELTRLPHPAGSPRDRELAEWTAAQFREAGLENVILTTHEVMLPRPLEVVVEMTHPRRWRASLSEEPVDDPDTHIEPSAAGLPYHAYSASGEVNASVIYAGYGTPREYQWLTAKGLDVRGKIVLVRYSRPYSYRGYKAFVAERRGAAGILMYSDPADDGDAKGKAYPEGPWSPRGRIERGAIAYDFLVPGDPLTPGWASTPGARRIRPSDAVSLPGILSVPLSGRDAGAILDALSGPLAPNEWQGALGVPYRVGAGPASVRMNVRMDDGIRPVWTVTGMLRGTQFPDEIVIVGNHRDAWVFGGVDPSSGSAALVELARSIGGLVREGWRPKRSLMFASWDAEEFAVISSTEWAEQHAVWLRDRAVAYLNVDSAASGSRFVAGAVPSLAPLIREVAAAVNDPVARIPVAAVSRDRARQEGALTAEESDAPVVDERLGGGSDYTVFLNHLGIPAADLGFEAPNGVYHSLYDTHGFVSRIADPGFRYHAALVELWGMAALRLIQADAVPLDPDASSTRVLDQIRQARVRVPGNRDSLSLSLVEAAARELKAVTTAFGKARRAALDAENSSTLSAMNRRVIRFERAFLDPEGLPGRPWYRHLIHAPQFTYEPRALPALADAIDSGDVRRINVEADRLTGALRRAAACLSDADQ